MNIRFLEFTPALNLQPYVQCFWTGEFNINAEPDFSQSVLPNGVIELIIHLTDKHCTLAKEKEGWHNSPEYTFVGLYTGPYEVRFPGTVQVFGIRFHPEGIMNIFGLPPSHLQSTFEDGSDLFGDNFKELCNRLRENVTTHQRINLSEDFLQKRLARISRNFDYIHLAAQTIRHHNGLIDHEKLMTYVPISPRQLQREFKNKYGITTKAYMRIMRYNAVQKYMNAVKTVDYGDVTFAHGFADQSHLIREFKTFTGASPRSFIKRRKDFIVNVTGSMD